MIIWKINWENSLLKEKASSLSQTNIVKLLLVVRIIILFEILNSSKTYVISYIMFTSVCLIVKKTILRKKLQSFQLKST